MGLEQMRARGARGRSRGGHVRGAFREEPLGDALEGLAQGAPTTNARTCT